MEKEYGGAEGLNALTAWRISAQNAALPSAQPCPERAVQAGEVTPDHAGVCRKGLLLILLGMSFHSFWILGDQCLAT